MCNCKGKKNSQNLLTPYLYMYQGTYHLYMRSQSAIGSFDTIIITQSISLPVYKGTLVYYQHQVPGRYIMSVLQYMILGICAYPHVLRIVIDFDWTTVGDAEHKDTRTRWSLACEYTGTGTCVRGWVAGAIPWCCKKSPILSNRNTHG